MSTKQKQWTRVEARKVSSSRSGLLALMFLAVGMLSGCGGGSTNSPGTPAPSPVSVSVSPPATSVDQGDTFQFSASVTGNGDQAVTWSVQEGAAAGSITPAGLYKAPAAAMDVHVVVTSVADPSKSSSALVTVRAVSVSLPATAGARFGGQQQFIAVVEGTVVKDVNWSIEEGSAGGTITDAGVYSAPMSGGPFHVTARSVADPSKAATAAVVLTDHGFRMLNSSTLEPRYAHTATLLPNGKVLIAGGISINVDGSSGNLVASAELFDPATETFTATGPMSSARAGHIATLLNNGTVLVTGGRNATAEVYDPATGGFTPVGNMVAERGAHTASLLGDGRVLIAGGQHAGPDAFAIYPVATAEIYDPTTQTFTRVGDMPNKAASHTASVLLEGRVLVAGGYSGSCPGTQDGAAIFDPASKSFSAGASLPGARAEHTATTLNDGRVLIAGGAFEDDCNLDGFIYDTAVVFDPATSSYSPEKKMSEPRYQHSATLLLDGKVLVVGSTADLFDPATSSFAITGGPNVNRADRRATRLADGRVLFTGSTAVAEIYE
ncbi:MAG TPA: kelch repeat-containing protein [Terriglobia bacterium]|nr:kelch repeat-containing protein [Terriglobia bacterium]